MTTEQSSLMEDPEQIFKRKKKDKTKNKKKRRSTNVMKVITNFFLCRGCKTQFNI